MFTQATRDYISALSDEALAEYVIVGEDNSYDPEAISYARNELARRNITTDRSDRLQSTARMKAAEEIASRHTRAAEPLDAWWRFVGFSFAAALTTPIGWISVAWLFHSGQNRKAKDLIYYSLLGYGVWSVLLGLVAGDPIVRILFICVGISVVIAMILAIRRLGSGKAQAVK